MASVTEGVLGPANVMIPFTGAAGILIYAWPFARTEASILVITVLYGFVILYLPLALTLTRNRSPSLRFCSGAYVSLLSNPMMELGPTEDLGRRLGMFMSIFALGALAGPPISGAIKTATGGFEAVGYYAGSSILCRHMIFDNG
jgi:MCP family monocarboxylic acid transporter-like MFS transporter 10